MSNKYRHDGNEAARVEHRKKVGWRELTRAPRAALAKLALWLALSAALGAGSASASFGAVWLVENGDFALAFGVHSAFWALALATLGTAVAWLMSNVHKVFGGKS